MWLKWMARVHGYDIKPIVGYDKGNLAVTFRVEKECYVSILSVGKEDDR